MEDREEVSFLACKETFTRKGLLGQKGQNWRFKLSEASAQSRICHTGSEGEVFCSPQANFVLCLFCVLLSTLSCGILRGEGPRALLITFQDLAE